MFFFFSSMLLAIVVFYQFVSFNVSLNSVRSVEAECK